MKQWEILIAFIAVAAGIWAYIRRFFNWIRGFVLVTHWVSPILGGKLASHLSHGKSSVRTRFYTSIDYWVRPLNGMSPVAVEELNHGSRLFFVKRMPLWFKLCKGTEIPDNAHTCNITFVRGTINFEELLHEAAVTAHNWQGSNPNHRFRIIRHHGKFSPLAMINSNNKLVEEETSTFVWQPKSIIRPIHWKAEDLIMPPNDKAFDYMALSADMEQTIADVRTWYISQEWYQERGITWRKGYEFTGGPGTGKTSMARAIGQDLNVPVNIFDLASMTNDELVKSWSTLKNTAPCIALIEDIDAVFHGRTNVAPISSGSGQLTFDTLLNCVDGIEQTDGILFIITTNHPELVDPALSERPGRIDRVVTFKNIDLAGRLKVAYRIIGESAEAERLALDNGNLSPAQFTELCIRQALSDKFKTPHPYRESSNGVSS